MSKGNVCCAKKKNKVKKVVGAPRGEGNKKRVHLHFIFYLGNIILAIMFFLVVTSHGCYFLPEYSSSFPSYDVLIYNKRYIFGLHPVPSTELLKPLEFLKC